MIKKVSKRRLSSLYIISQQLTNRDTGMTVEYACVFGISSPIPGLLTGEHVNSYSNGLCVITFHGKDGRVFWFIIEKLSQKFLYPNTPRYSASDAAEFCGRLSSVRVWKNIHVADLWKNKLCASMTALEEGMYGDIFRLY